jgi:hypothetical protein
LLENPPPKIEFSGVNRSKARVLKPRLSTDELLLREKERIAREVVRVNEGKRKRRFRPQDRLSHIAKLMADDRVEKEARRRLGLKL